MRVFSILMGMAVPLLAGGVDDAHLDYRLKVRTREEPAAVESAFRMVATPALSTRNRVHRPRMGSWQIEPLVLNGKVPTPAMLVRALGFCYFSGPAAQVVPLEQGMTIGKRWCRLWQVQTPPGVGVYAYLAEVSPGLLALAYLSTAQPDGDLSSLEIHLSGVALGRRPVPAEEGTALLRTLQHLAERTRSAPDPEAVETEAVP